MKGLFFKKADIGYEIISEPVVSLYDGIHPAIEVVIRCLDNNEVNVIEVSSIDTVETDKSRIGY